MRIERKIVAVGAVIVVVMALAAAIPYLLHEQVDAVLGALSATAARERAYESLLDTLGAAETGQRAYLISGREEFLRPYYGALAALVPLRTTLREQHAGPGARAAYVRIEGETDAVLGELDEGLRRHRAGLAPLPSDDAAVPPHLAHLRRLIGGEIAVHNQQRDALRARLSNASALAVDAGIGATLLNLAILLPALGGARRALRERSVARERARRAARSQREIADAAELRSRHLAECSRLLHALQLAEGAPETAAVIGSHLGKMFPTLAGALYLYRNSRDALERRGSWGGAGASPDWPTVLEPGDCWALRRGGPYQAGAGDVACRHAHLRDNTREGTNEHTLCVPLVSHGEVIGAVSMAGQALGDSGGAQLREWIIQLSEQLALALANIELRARLRLQSFVDPLTQLYNRRYLDETFRRELLRAERGQQRLSVVLIDLDHFKRVNDSYGHEAGDALLSLLGNLLRDAVRGADTACRYGGEELLVLMPDCGHGDALQRAEDLRARIAAIVYRTGVHGHLSPTASMGVASFPQHGGDAAALVAAADAALYRAKQGGRNRVCGAEAVPLLTRMVQGRAPDPRTIGAGPPLG
jgi:diguanylate cyclase (GGDEF)-like protein